MTTNTQRVPVETWDTEPKLKVVGRNGDKPATYRSAPKMAAAPVVLRQERPELEVLGWQARVGRLVSLSRGNR
jgi:hypothetical protein